jgi:hypothetical protein
MKTFFLTVLMLLAFCRAQAQVSLALSLDQDEYLPNEPLRVTIKITNTSGQPLHLGADPNWLTFGVESVDGFVVEKKGNPPLTEEFDLESPQMATLHVDLQPYFVMDRPARYKLTATMHIKQWRLTVNSAPVVQFDVIHGGELWSQDFGVTLTTNAPPEARKYSLVKANYLREQLRLYVQVSDGGGGIIYKVEPLGPMVSFSMPEESLDRFSRLHVLWQTGGQSFDYAVVAPDGMVLSRDIYDNYGSRPHLVINGSGDIEVHGGARRPNPDELPETNTVPTSSNSQTK